MKKSAAIFMMCFLVSIFVFGQDYKGKARVFGFVLDDEGNPLEEVKVKLFSIRGQSGFEIVTDAKGKWVASWIRGGKWNLDFEKIGYMPKKISIEVNEYGRNPAVEVYLKKVEGLVLTPELTEALNQADGLYEGGKYQEALDKYSDILVQYPDAHFVDKNIGNCYFKMGKYEEAEKHYLKILDKEPDNGDIQLLVGNCYANRGQNEIALEWYNKIEFEKITDPLVIYNIGTNYYNLSKFQEALKYYRRATEIQDDFLDAIYQVGLTHLNLGNYKDSLTAFEDYLQQDSDSARASQVKGFIEFLKSKIEEKQ